ncbi:MULTISPECIES: DUF6869 domain-containing protein [Luteibacter]|uniref:DUF6869 domain-containing protein n=1 Tax=Luteibacter TaxID=242605 RepID=UPI0006896340|nr:MULTISPECIES: hypothetical protein [unclassified Luteibacter]
MTMSDAELESWATAYIEGVQDPARFQEDHALWWSIERFHDTDTPGDDIWNVILHILAKSPPKEVLGMLAAGPLEDLIHYRGADFIDRIEIRARQDPAFRELLNGVWESSSPDVWARVERACARTMF